MLLYDFLLKIVLVVKILSQHSVLSMTPLNGRYTKSIEFYNLTVPHKSNSLGEFVTFDLPQFFQYDPMQQRKKRSLEDSEMVHYGLTLNGHDYYVDLWPNPSFISPDLILEHRDPKLRSETERVKRLNREKVCHYTGVVKNHQNSRVALSTCDGLAGYITIDNKRYFIEPMENHQPNSDGHHLHVIHQETNTDKTDRCGTKEDWKEAWKQRFREKFLQGKEEKRGILSEHRFLEILIVADKKFITHHKHKDIELYIMTIMNMVSDFYHDASSGNQMDVVVVRIMYLEKEEEEIDLAINEDAEKTLESFCNWQVKINPKDIANPNHHDIAVLLTRYDICADEGADCGLMGLAYIATACTQNRNCAINEDGGLNLGIIVAHEIGHVMGCAHDAEGDSPCGAQDKDQSFFLMAPYVHMFTTKWSSCSRGFITALFENSMGDCLNDEPEVSLYTYKMALPGTIYDVETQCDIMYPGSKVCTLAEAKFCEMLVCKTDPDTCISNREPPADGTKCGMNKWCFHKKCIEIGERPEAVNGGWGGWGPYSSCSRTCGGGVATSERNCDSPAPQYGGRYCLGERKRFKICNKNACPFDTPTYREVQCTEQNTKPYNGKLHTWKPYYKKGEPCVLYCLNEKKIFAKLAVRAKDGTPCKAGTKNMCISGVCMNVGCDFQLNSDAVEDVCGICNGDGSQCKIIDEVYKDTGARDYKKVATIPQGSRNVRIEELAPSVNTIAIADKSEKVFYLNGNHRENRDGTKLFGGVEGVYDHPEPGKETLIIHGPTKEDLIFFVVFYSPENVGYRYRYSEPSADLNYAPQYHWEMLDWSDCSVKCGGGLQTSKYECVEEKSGKVSSTFCAGESKPPITTKSCNEIPCLTKWKVGRWGPCYACKNLPGMRSREVECVRENPKIGAEDILVEDEECEEDRPASKEICNSHKKCKTRHADQLPEYLLEDISRQINKRQTQNGAKLRRELNLEGLMKAIEGNTITESCTNKSTHVKLTQGNIIKDRIPENEIKIVKIPFKDSQLSLNLSDNAFETMGDSLSDKLDTGEAVIATGADAAKILKELGHNEEEREEMLTSTVSIKFKKKKEKEKNKVKQNITTKKSDIIKDSKNNGLINYQNKGL